MLARAVIFLLVVMLPFCMAVVSIQRLGLDGEYEPSDMLFCILPPWSISIGENSRIKSEVTVVTCGTASVEVQISVSYRWLKIACDDLFGVMAFD